MNHTAHRTVSIVSAKDAYIEDILRIWNECIHEGDSLFWTEAFHIKEMTELLQKQDDVGVAIIEQHVVGFYILHPNNIGRGKHIANALYAVDRHYRSQGIGTLLGKYSIEKAIELKYGAIQFNSVVKSNHKSVQLWTKLGFQIVGEVPDAFLKKNNEYESIYIMYKKL